MDRSDLDNSTVSMALTIYLLNLSVIGTIVRFGLLGSLVTMEMRVLVTLLCNRGD
jgi:hypothetical protein